MHNPAHKPHTTWCDQAEHLASGEPGCRRIVAEVEGVGAMLLDSGGRVDVAIVGAAGKPLWWWPPVILGRVAEALTIAMGERARLT